MLRVTVLCQGRLKECYFIAACQEYLKRLTAYCRPEVVELPEKGDIAPHIPKGAYVIALCVEGKRLDSPGLARLLDRVCFLIGGSDGLTEADKGQAALRLSMSDMTFPHHLARVMLLEQIYRAFTISAGAKYHK